MLLSSRASSRARGCRHYRAHRVLEVGYFRLREEPLVDYCHPREEAAPEVVVAAVEPVPLLLAECCYRHEEEAVVDP